EKRGTKITGPQDYYPCLFLLGERDRARAEVQGIRPEGFFLSLFDYMRDPGPANEGKFVQAAGQSKKLQCLAHWLIAYIRRGAGDRHAPTRYSQAAVPPHPPPTLPAALIARALLARLEREPNWPPWIKETKVEPKP